MTLLQICIFIIISLLTGAFIPKSIRGWFIIILNILAVFWLQPVSPIRHLDFWLPVVGIFLVVLAWFLSNQSCNHRQTWITIGIISGTIVAVSLLRYLDPICCITASRPPSIIQILIFAIPAILIICLINHQFPGNKRFTVIIFLVIVSIFIILKTDIFTYYSSKILRSLSGQDQSLASPLDLGWIGFSYLAFRLLHYLRDNQTGKIPANSLDEFFNYALFFPAYSAGPIERFPNFLKELRKPIENRCMRLWISPHDFYQGSIRIVNGVFKKFVLADTLAIIALNSQNAAQINSTFWAWVILYAYSFRIYFDFSGYTDIAIGLGRYMGVQLPENFASPYLKTNLAMFWNCWHITLAQWFRAYIFNPLTRFMRTAKFNFPAWLIILSAQFSTMILIGLWHGVTLNFAIWGLWHAAGLFFHNRWSDWRKSHHFYWENIQGVNKMLTFISWLITFNYTVLGWVWFALPNPQISGKILGILFGAK